MKAPALGFTARTIARFALVAAGLGIALSPSANSQAPDEAQERLRNEQVLRNQLFEKIAPGVVSVELVHRSLPAWELAQLERWSNECRLQPFRCGDLSEQEAEQWRDWCDSFLMEVETRMAEGRLDPSQTQVGDWQNFVRQMLSDWQTRERPFLVEGLEGSFDKFIAALGQQVTHIDGQIAALKTKPLPLRQNTGFIIDKGLVVTTFDVARHRGVYNHIRVWSDAQVQYSTGEVIGQDPETNIALIKLSSPGADLRPTLNIVPDEAAKVGDFVFAFWHAFSQPLSMRSGEITGVMRRIPIFHCATFIETSLPTSPGTLGAPLVNLDGDLIGMGAVFMAQGAMTEVTFALPIQQLLPVIDQLRRDGTVQRGRLGVSVFEVMDAHRQCKNVVVKEVDPNSSAARHGLRAGDIISAVNGESIHCRMHLVASLSRFRPHDLVELAVKRQGETIQVAVNLDPMQ